MCFCYPTVKDDDMEPRSKVKFVLTGFGCFDGVACNPTEAVVQQLPGHLASRKAGALAGGAELKSATVLRVSAKEVQLWLQERAAELAAEEPAQVVFVHLGVDMLCRCHKLEAQARNCADFRVPDQDGWQPHSVPIDPRQRTSSCLRTDLPLEALTSALRAESHAVRISADAGLYVCNWTLYCSLQLAQRYPRHQWHSLFLHCPPEEVCPLGEQVRVTAAVLDHLGALLGPPPGQPSPRGLASPRLAPSPKCTPEGGPFARGKSLEEGGVPALLVKA